jgi:pyrimidine-nucleoside phosphorylase
MIDLIARKRDGGELSGPEIEFVARAAGAGSVPDYQLSAWLMACFLRGLSRSETAALTRAMARSGRTLDLSGVSAPKVDKHSTGGVGDGISIALAPLLASAGLAVPMMSGRGLGHTGGTLDKLESIPGFKVRIPMDQVERQIRKIGVCMFGQSGELAPADGKLYALRDASGSVESRSLIVASILSKKAAEDLDALVIDVKSGRGAFFKTRAQAEALASELLAVARSLGLRCSAVLTAMEQPLGPAVGNSLEVRQAIAALKGDFSAADYAEVLLELGGRAMALAGAAKDAKAGAARLTALIESGEALARFRLMVREQGGDDRVADDPEKFLPASPLRREIQSPADGYLALIDAKAIGRAAVALGAGRDRQEDPVDFGAGFVFLRKSGDKVRRGETVAAAYASDKARLAEGSRQAEAAVSVVRSKPRLAKTILRAMP